jgi:Tfp pilus assembly protein PilF
MDLREAVRASHLAHDAYHRRASDAHLARGQQFLAAGEVELAIQDFTKALDLHRGNKVALAARASAYRLKGSELLAQADEIDIK